MLEQVVEVFLVPLNESIDAQTSFINIKVDKV